MKFNLSDFLQLDTKELLAVNGGSPCSSSSGSPSSSPSDGSGAPSSSSTNSSDGGNGGNSNPSVTRNPNGTVTYHQKNGQSFTYRTQGNNNSSKNGNNDNSSKTVPEAWSGGSGSSGGGSCSTSTSNNPNGQGPSTTSSNPGGNQHKDTKIHSGGGTCTKTGGHSPVNPNPTNPDDVTSGGGTCSGGSSSGGSTGEPDSTSTSGGTTETTQDKNALIQERLFRAIKKVGPHSYDIADETNPNEYRCDEYVADILERGGFNVYDYCVDDPVEKSVDDHYHDMLNKKLEMITDRNDLEQGASYILVMRDQDGILDSHIGLYINGGENGYCYVDNSGSNYGNLDGNLGGTETHKGANISEVLADYHNYEYMYFVKLQ